ncbi:MAG: membrane protein insertion efficiency factor YidD [candidate division WOR-3 bacterium]|nr:MAG: membrane protein insertion efficiency factor YidD [candidate division WOR-3 bacterium]
MQALLILLLLAQSPHQTNPVKIVTGTCFRLYQNLISPSQGDVCNYSPSCSHFARQSIDRYGIFWGSLMASDRLLRCNPWAYQSFDKHYVGIKEHKFYDPIENNFILRPIERQLTNDSTAKKNY